jgi:hypothetical protein
MKATVLGFIALLCVGMTNSQASTVTLNFDSLPSMDYFSGAPIPAAAQLSTQYLDTYGVSFTSVNPYVAVVNLGVGHATSGTNGIGGSTPVGILTYDRQYPIIATFFSPSHPHATGITDFVSLRGDLAGSNRPITLNAYDVNHQLIATFTTLDVGGATLSVAAPGIHSVEFLGTADTFGVAVDDFTFNSVTPFHHGHGHGHGHGHHDHWLIGTLSADNGVGAVPEPSTWAMMLLGFAGLGFAFRQSRRTVLRLNRQAAGHALSLGALT